MATQFRYTAVDADGKTVQGTLEAVDEQSARDALEKLHVEVTSIQEARRQSGLQTEPKAAEAAPMLALSFAFEGTDPAGTVRRGSIQAQNKYQAFEKLSKGQSLYLTMLSPVGTTPQYRDPELMGWQKAKTPVVPPVATKIDPIIPAPAPVAPLQTPVPKRVGFANAEVPSAIPTAAIPISNPPAEHSNYHPISATLRLYAGWLIAWYGLFAAFGYYAHVRSVPFDLPFVEAFALSPFILSFTVAIFLYLLLGTLHRAMHGRLVSGIVFTIVGVAVFLGVKGNIQ